MTRLLTVSNELWRLRSYLLNHVVARIPLIGLDSGRGRPG
jgi:hypothetical protein